MTAHELEWPMLTVELVEILCQKRERIITHANGRSYRGPPCTTQLQASLHCTLALFVISQTGTYLLALSAHHSIPSPSFAPISTLVAQSHATRIAFDGLEGAMCTEARFGKLGGFPSDTQPQ